MFKSTHPRNMPVLSYVAFVAAAVFPAMPQANAQVVCDPNKDICFGGIGDLPGGNHSSEALGVANVDDVTVVVGACSTAASFAANPNFREACKFSNGTIRAIISPSAGLTRSNAEDVAIVGTSTIIAGTTFSNAFRIVQAGNELINPNTNSLLPCGPVSNGRQVCPLFANSISDNGNTVVGDTHSFDQNVIANGYRYTASTNSTVVIPAINPTSAAVIQNSANGVSPNGTFAAGITRAGTSSAPFYSGYVTPQPNTICVGHECGPVSTGDFPGGFELSEMFSVSNSGVAVGYGHSSGNKEAMMWIPGSPFPSRPAQRISLGDLPGGLAVSEALSISGDGSVVVGTGTTNAGAEAFIRHINFGMRNLRELMAEDQGVTGLTGWTLRRANAISNNGLAIAGTGTNPSGQTEGWFITLPDCNDNGMWDGLEAPYPTKKGPRSVVQFDGTDDFLELATPSPELRITGNLTVEAWVYPNLLDLTQTVVALGEVGESLGSNILYSVETTSGGDIIITHERSDLSDVVIFADTNLRTGRWSHIAVTRIAFSQTTMEYAVQIDGGEPLVFGASGRPAGGTSGRLRVGRAAGTSPDRPFQGAIADVRIWNVARTHDQIVESMFTSSPADTTGLIASWKLDDPSGNTFADSTGSNDLTLGAGGLRLTLDADCNQNRIPDACEVDCNRNGVPDACDVQDPSLDCDNDGQPDACGASEVLEALFDQDQATAQVFRDGRVDPNSPTTFGTMIQRYGRPWKPGTGQKPGGGVCVGGTRNGLVCPNNDECPGGSCEPPQGTGATRDPAERLRMLVQNATCLNADIAQVVFEELFAFEMLLGNEAFSDAVDPTVGEGSLDETISLDQVPGIFSFNGLPSVSTLLAEELALLRGREIVVPPSLNVPFNDEPVTNGNGNYPQFGTATRTAIYNRLRPNATDTLGSIGYRSNYGFTSTTNNAIASGAFPQGHGDAYGNYLYALKVYLNGFGAADNPEFAQSMIQSQLIPAGDPECVGTDCENILDDDGLLHRVGFQSVRNMGAAMAARARTVNRIVDLTFRQEYREDVDTQLVDTDTNRAWGIADWARRGGVGAYLDWAALNHLLSVPVEGAPDEIESVHRGRVDEVRILASAVEEMQERVDAAGAGLNPLGLVPNVVPFRIIQPGQLLNFLQGGASAGKSHYGIVRDAAVEAVKNARGILQRANKALNRLRGNEEQFGTFENQVRESHVGLSNRLIEIFGLPSADDRADNDFEDNDGDGVQLTLGINDPDDDFLESGCNGECAGNPDLQNFLVDAQGIEELGFAERSAVGQVQLGMFEFRTALLKIQMAEQAISALEALIQDKAENVALTRNEAIQALEIQATACNDRVKVIDRKEQLEIARAESGLFSGFVGYIVGAAKCAAAPGAACGDVIKSFTDLAFSDPFGDINDKFDIEVEELRINCWQTASLTRISNDQTIRALEIELEDLIRKTPQAILELAVAQNQAAQAFAVVQKNVQDGKRSLDERDRIRRVQSDKLQDFRFRDMAFRTFRNQALEQYGAFYDLASRYVMLAARAFAYEYNERDEVDDQMRALYRERLLGTESATDQGLESIISRLDQKRQESDFTSRLQKLSLFDQGGDEFSLRKNFLGLAIDPSQDDDQQQFNKNKAFRAFLESNIVQDLRDVPAFAQFASLDSDRDSGPALVLNFSTEVAGRTLFGKRRGTTFGAPANFDTCSNPKLFEFAILLEGVDNPGALGVDGPLIFAHFLPVGSSMVRAPETGDCALRSVRTWAVVDQRIPGVSAAYRDSGGAVLDAFDIPRLATSEELYLVNRFPVTQAQLRQTENPVFQDELAGWSVWNTQWLLAIPGRQFADPSDDPAEVRRKLLILIFDADQNGNPRSPNQNLGIDDIKLRIKAYGKPS